MAQLPEHRHLFLGGLELRSLPPLHRQQRHTIQRDELPECGGMGEIAIEHGIEP